jgi:hypothetical protein
MKTRTIGIFALLAFLVMSTASASEYYLVPQDSTVSGHSDTAEVELWLDASAPAAGGFVAIEYASSCANIIGYSPNKEFYEDHSGTPVTGRLNVLFAHWGTLAIKNLPAGQYHLGNLTIQCCDGTSDCETDLLFVDCELSENVSFAPSSLPFTTRNGTFTCETPPSTTAGVVINEFVSDGTEWIELYNAGTEPVNLAGWTLQDTVASHVITLSETIPVDGYVVLDCSWLNDAGDTIYLNDTNGNTDDTVAYGDHGDAPNPDDGESAGRNPNGVDTNNDAADFIIFDIPTQGAANGIPVPVCTITSCDSSGVEKDQFAPGENVYVEGSGLEASTSYTIWIQNESVEGGDALNGDEDPSGSQEPVTTDASGNLPRTEIWAISQDEDVTYTEYDIVVDDGDDTYNAASDYIDSATTAGIVAPIPELPTFILTGIGILGLVLLAQRRE